LWEPFFFGLHGSESESERLAVEEQIGQAMQVIDRYIDLAPAEPAFFVAPRVILRAHSGRRASAIIMACPANPNPAVSRFRDAVRGSGSDTGRRKPGHVLVDVIDSEQDHGPVAVHLRRAVPQHRDPAHPGKPGQGRKVVRPEPRPGIGGTESGRAGEAVAKLIPP